MKKILFFITCFLGLAFFLQSTSPVYAWLKESHDCTDYMQNDGYPEDIRCDPSKDECKQDPNADPSLGIINKCLPKAGSPGSKPVECKCQKDNDVNNVKFTCGGSSKTAKCIANPGIDACYTLTTGDKVSTDATNNDAYGIYSSEFPHQELLNVMCRPKQPLADCTCDSENDINNNKFTCRLESDKSITGTAYCDHKVCVKADGNTSQEAQNQKGAAWDSHPILKNIKCTAPVADCTCDHSGQPGSGQNSFSCTFNGKTEHGFCAHEDMECDNDPNSTTDSTMGGIVKDPLFNSDNVGGATLKGITCKNSDKEVPKDPTNPPPPSPPCLQYASNGTCASFGTGIGDLTTDTGGFITRIFSILLAISGGIAVFLVIRSGYTLMTSQGKPDQINQGREQLIAAIVGLLFLIFSFVILEVIGVDILRVPGLSAGSGGTTAPPGVGAGCNAVTGAGCGSGTTCVSLDGGASGICKESTGASCDMNAVTSQCPSGQSCVSDGTGNGRPGHCK